jgi:hypothetical protein
VNILNLTDFILLKGTEELVKKEKSFTIQIIEHLGEIQRRKAFIERGCSSLFLYCTKILKYSGAEAHHRIYAMKLTRKNPLAKNKIAEGKLSLTNASKVGAHIEKNKIKNPDEIAALIDLVCEKSTREAEVILFDLLPAGTKRNIKIEISVKTYEKFEQYRMKYGTYNDEEIMQKLLDAALADTALQKQDEDPVEKASTKLNATLALEKIVVNKSPVTKNSRYIPTIVRQTILTRASGQCESVLRENNIRCQEKRGLEFDHIKPFALGGTNDVKNIRLLCRNCNQREAFKVFGDAFDFMSSFV